MDAIIAKILLAVTLASACTALRAADPSPARTCQWSAGDFLSSGEKQNGHSVDRLARELPEIVEACRSAVASEPKSAPLHARYARVLAVAGEAPQAFAEARAGADLGSSMATNLLGVMYAEGSGVARDYGAALKLFRDAAKRDHPLAYFNLAVMQANGLGTPQDDVEAVASLNAAARGYDPIAMQILGESYATGRAVGADPATAERWWRKAIERPQAWPEGRRNPARLSQLGRLAPDGAALLAWYERLARAGDLRAQNYVGHLYEAGQWVAQDYATARTWYERAAMMGDVPAQMSMAMLYSEGLGVERDPKESRRWAMKQLNDGCDRAAQAEPGADACDRFAADLYDPGKVVPGMSAYCMRGYAERAIPACRRAVKDFPGTVRYRAQLARALAHAGKFGEARREASAAAAKGSTLAMTLLGAMSERGYGGAKDEARALAWYKKAADLGDDRAVKLVSSKAYEGVGVAKGSPEAKALLDDMSRRLWKSANARGAEDTVLSRAEKGDARSQHSLAARFEREKKYDEAVKWYTAAAAQGYGPSQMNLAQMYENGIGVRRSSAEAIRWYRKAVEVGDGESRWQLANLYAAKGSYAEAVPLYNRSIEHDDYRAMLQLGEMYEHGRGVKKDMDEAVRLYERAADRSPWAQAKLGALYSGGHGVPKDEAKALAYTERAAQTGEGTAQASLGWMYEQGIGVRRDYAKALDWYLSANARGVPQARVNLEHFYEDGRGAPAEPKAAVSWYRTGAEASIASAQYRLGTFYARGEGVERSDAESLKWFVKAAEQGHAKARSEAGSLLFALGQKHEKGDGVARDEKVANEYYLQAAGYGNARARQLIVARAGAAGGPKAAAEVAAMLAPARRAPATLPPRGAPAGDPGEDKSRTLLIRSAGSAQMESSAVAADAYEVIFYYEPTPSTKAQP